MYHLVCPGLDMLEQSEAQWLWGGVVPRCGCLLHLIFHYVRENMWLWVMENPVWASINIMGNLLIGKTYLIFLMDLIFLIELKKLSSQVIGKPGAAGPQRKKPVSETQPEPFAVAVYFFLLVVGWLYSFSRGWLSSFGRKYSRLQCQIYVSDSALLLASKLNRVQRLKNSRKRTLWPS